MELSEYKKREMFEYVLRLEHLAEMETYCRRPEAEFKGRNYNEQSEGAFGLLTILGLGKEYIWWSYGK